MQHPKNPIQPSIKDVPIPEEYLEELSKDLAQEKWENEDPGIECEDFCQCPGESEIDPNDYSPDDI